MPYYRTCPDCGSSLDPGERCDCHGNWEFPVDLGKTQGKEKAAPDATNIQSGKVEQKSDQLHCSASILTNT